MNKYDERYEIRLGTTDDIDKIMHFIRNEWRADHVFATNREYFCYEHQKGDIVNFVLAIDRSTKEIEGILGFIEASQNLENKDIWGAMWMVRENHNNLPFLGVELHKRLSEITQCRTKIGVGANPKTAIPVLKLMLKVKADKMRHYYRLNDKQEYRIAIINEKNIIEISELKKKCNKQHSLRLFSSIDDLNQVYDLSQNISKIPYKDSWYVNKRYFKHPIYKYNVWGIMNEKGSAEAIIIGREVLAADAKVLRIVDFIGNQEMLAGVAQEIQDMIATNDYEYIDFYCYGFDDSFLKNAGFVLRTDNDKNIIPNYFEPFLQQNIDIWVHTRVDNITICKGDGDQDRPSVILK